MFNTANIKYHTDYTRNAINKRLLNILSENIPSYVAEFYSKLFSDVYPSTTHKTHSFR
ncbi:hypothetical protein [Deferribacter desulfuricans]|uniref:hypothetical protein n=1 Tax=Deferribacter desulfuricans TaxID=197162 RepID=UPI0002FB6F42|nr:hypothetical protein [Deferribacter desulfuricans]